jgi:ATP-dependent Clp protease ATP-binding subunit ClpA
VPAHEGAGGVQFSLGAVRSIIQWYGFSESAKRVLDFASEECDDLGGGIVGIGHLLLGLLREVGSYAAQLLRERGADPAESREKLAASEP